MNMNKRDVGFAIGGVVVGAGLAEGIRFGVRKIKERNLKKLSEKLGTAPASK